LRHCRRGAIGRVDRRLRPLVTPLPGLSSGWLSRCLSSLRRLPSAGASHCGIAFRASRPSGWLSRLLASHAATSHLPATFSRADRTVNTKLDRKTSSEDRGVVYQTNRKGLLKTTEHSLTVLD
jgi:hypothetical protein